jgi:ABC-type lipopolysaccharide export system ATPase subunit
MKKIAFLCLFLFSCSPKERVQKPENLMSPDQMVAFLIDINIINASRGYRNQDGISYVSINDSIIYKIHQIDSLQFVNSNAYYASKPKEYLKIYELVEEKIDRLKDSLNTRAEEEKKSKNKN